MWHVMGMFCTQILCFIFDSAVVRKAQNLIWFIVDKVKIQ